MLYRKSKLIQKLPFILLFTLKESERRERKGRHCRLGDVLKCRTSHLAARMICRTVFGRTTILGGWWFDVVGTGGSSIFPKHPFCHVCVLIFILFSKSSCCLMPIVRHCGVPKRSATTFPSLLSNTYSIIRIQV